ncbi:unnamed protein product [Pleuronectes platessa]|uniref:Uncharacterized protein n=1 Tax=Pleuronectes platessa TaxID=8262 RepID=A0A9N7YDJ5_PLEPL|nr:unnamed protein product [Pleuronectes platessa]
MHAHARTQRQQQHRGSDQFTKSPRGSEPGERRVARGRRTGGTTAPIMKVTSTSRVRAARGTAHAHGRFDRETERLFLPQEQTAASAHSHRHTQRAARAQEPRTVGPILHHHHHHHHHHDQPQLYRSCSGISDVTPCLHGGQHLDLRYRGCSLSEMTVCDE